MASIVYIQTNDGKTFECESNLVFQCGTVKTIIEDFGFSDPSAPIPLPLVDSKMFEKILQFCKYADGKSEELISNYSKKDISIFEREFFEVENEYILDIMMAANYLAHTTLLEACCTIIAEKLKDQTTKEIRQNWGIDNDFAPGEEDQLRAQSLH